MGYGTGTSADIGWGDPDSWGGPDNGIDVQTHLGLVDGTVKQYRMSEDAWLAIIIIGSLVTLWLLGGVAFKSFRI